MINKLIVDGKVAVLVAPSFGAGWSTWNSELADFFTLDKGLVQLALSKASMDDVKAYLDNALPDHEYLCLLGWGDISVHWLPIGTAFRIHEYDGSESLVVYNPSDYMVA